MNKLTNTDIINRLLEIRRLPNACDRVEALKQFSKEYKHSKFYKTTHKNLTLLYYEVMVEDLFTLRSLLTSVQNFINNLDLDGFNNLMDQVNAQSLQNIEANLDALNESGILDILKGHKA